MARYILLLLAFLYSFNVIASVSLEGNDCLPENDPEAQHAAWLHNFELGENRSSCSYTPALVVKIDSLIRFWKKPKVQVIQMDCTAVVDAIALVKMYEEAYVTCVFRDLESLTEAYGTIRKKLDRSDSNRIILKDKSSYISAKKYDIAILSRTLHINHEKLDVLDKLIKARCLLKSGGCLVMSSLTDAALKDAWLLRKACGQTFPVKFKSNPKKSCSLDFEWHTYWQVPEIEKFCESAGFVFSTHKKVRSASPYTEGKSWCVRTDPKKSFDILTYAVRLN